MAESANNGSADKWDPQGMASAGLKNEPVLAQPFNLKREVDRPANNGGLFGKVKSWLGETPHYVPDTSNSEKSLLQAVSEAPSGMFLDKDKVVTMAPVPEQPVTQAEKPQEDVFGRLSQILDQAKTDLATAKDVEAQKAVMQKMNDAVNGIVAERGSVQKPSTQSEVATPKIDEVVEKDPLSQVSGLLVEVDAKLGEKFKAPPANPNLSYVGGLGSIEAPDAATLEQVGQLDNLRQQLVKWQEILSPSKGLNSELLAPPSVIQEEKKTEIDKRESNIREVRESKLKGEGFNGIDHELVPELLRLMEEKQKGALEDLSRFEDKWIPQELRFTGEKAGKDLVGEPKNDLEKKYKEQVEKWKEAVKKKNETAGANKDLTPDELAELQRKMAELDGKPTGDKAADLGVDGKTDDPNADSAAGNKEADANKLESAASMPGGAKEKSPENWKDRIANHLKRGWEQFQRDNKTWEWRGGALLGLTESVAAWALPIPGVGGPMKTLVNFIGVQVTTRANDARRKGVELEAYQKIMRGESIEKITEEQRVKMEQVSKSTERWNRFWGGVRFGATVGSLGSLAVDVLGPTVAHGIDQVANGLHSNLVSAADQADRLQNLPSSAVTNNLGHGLSGYGPGIGPEITPSPDDFLNLTVKVGENGGNHFWDSMDVPNKFLHGTAKGWLDGFGGNTQEDVLRSIVTNFASANGHDLGNLHTGAVTTLKDVISNTNPEITKQQLNIIKLALESKNGKDYADNVVPLFRQVLAASQGK